MMQMEYPPAEPPFNPPRTGRACAACGSAEEAEWRVIDGIDMRLCADAIRCCRRYRSGLPPETYAMGLRGELLAVAP